MSSNISANVIKYLDNQLDLWRTKYTVNINTFQSVIQELDSKYLSKFQALNLLVDNNMHPKGFEMAYKEFRNNFIREAMEKSEFWLKTE
jgi:hypothetical protein